MKRHHVRPSRVAISVVAASTLLVPAIALAAGDHPDRTNEVRQAIQGGKARNVILLIGDGMGDSEITIARNYAVGAAGRLALDTLPLTGQYTTYSLQEDRPNLPNYVPDSAAAGTAWATGHKTANDRISTTAKTDRVLRTILERAQSAGYATGDVTTAELTDATPAVLAAHVNDRDCQGPADMAPCPQYLKANGGPGSIAEQEVDHRVDVLMGGGADRFKQIIPSGRFAGQTVRRSAVAQGYRVVTNRTELKQATPDKRVLGLFAPSTMDLTFTGEPALPYPGSGPQRCRYNPDRPDSEPNLPVMTSKALDLLRERTNGKDKGFFLQVEGASIDKQDHAANPCGQIGENVAFDNAVGVALHFARSHPDTLVVVTADHGHTSQIIYPASTQTAEDHSPGIYSTLITHDGAEMTVNYGTNLPGRSQNHTGTQVRIAAQGPQAANVVGLTDQTDLFYTMARALGLGHD